MRHVAGAIGAATLAVLAVVAACSPQPDVADPVSDTTDSGLAGYGEDGFQCPVPLSSAFCCGQGPGCAVTWPAASSCATLEPPPYGTTYLVDATPCEGVLEIQTSVQRVIQGAMTTTTTFALFDSASGALTAVLEGPGTSSVGFSCDVGPVALAVSNACLAHWQSASGSDPCVDAGAAGIAEDAGCPVPEAGPGPDEDAAALDSAPE